MREILLLIFVLLEGLFFCFMMKRTDTFLFKIRHAADLHKRIGTHTIRRVGDHPWFFNHRLCSLEKGQEKIHLCHLQLQIMFRSIFALKAGHKYKNP